MQSARDLSTAQIRECASSSCFMEVQKGWCSATLRLVWGFTGIGGRLYEIPLASRHSCSFLLGTNNTADDTVKIKHFVLTTSFIEFPGQSSGPLKLHTCRSHNRTYPLIKDQCTHQEIYVITFICLFFHLKIKITCTHQAEHLYAII